MIVPVRAIDVRHNPQVIDQRFSDRHILVLDGLRGLAIIAVIFCHVNWRYGGPFSAGRIDGLVAMVYAWGWIGVDLFFVLSGFLITGILCDAKGREGYFRNFYARRALRIFPLYFGFLLGVIVLNRLGWLTNPWIARDNLLPLCTYTYNLRVGLGGGAVGGMHHFWTLAIEEQFYLLWPLLVLAVSSPALRRACLIIAAASFVLRVVIILSGAWPLSAFFLTPCRLDSLLAGSWLALAWRDPALWARIRPWAAPLAWGAGGLLLAISLGQGHFIPDADPSRMPDAAVDGRLVITLGVAALAVFFSAIVVLALNAAEESRLKRVFENRRLRAIGKYSYAMYVFHVLILYLTVQLFSQASILPLYVVKTLVVVWVLAVSFVVAWVSYHIYEKPFLSLRRHFEYDRSADAAALVSAPAHPLSDA
jgi:peptidoglycan/LPS O-acetylase OafA/YrhL